MEKPFIVTSEGHRFKFTPEKIGYSVSEIGVRGVNTQGDTFENALAMAHEASSMMAEFREELAAEDAMGRKKASSSAREPKGRIRQRNLAKV